MATDDQIPFGGLFPELQHFPDYDTRRHELREASRTVLRQRHRQLALAGLVIGCAISIALLIAFVKFLMQWKGNWLGGVTGGLSGGIGFIGANLLYRRPIQVVLREKLNQLGMPICIGCGYDLRGNTSGACPECGRATQSSDAAECDQPATVLDPGATSPPPR